MLFGIQPDRKSSELRSNGGLVIAVALPKRECRHDGSQWRIELQGRCNCLAIGTDLKRMAIAQDYEERVEFVDWQDRGIWESPPGTLEVWIPRCITNLDLPVASHSDRYKPVPVLGAQIDGPAFVVFGPHAACRLAGKICRQAIGGIAIHVAVRSSGPWA